MTILQGAGDDLGSRRGGAVDQDRDRCAGQHVSMRGSLEGLIFARLSAMDAQHGPAIEQIPGDVDGRRQEPTRIVAQIDNEPPEASVRVALEARDGLLESVRGVAAELADADIADPTGLKLRFYQFDPDDLPLQRDIEWLLLAAQDGERHGRSGIASQQAYDLAQALPLRARLVDHDNLVTRF